MREKLSLSEYKHIGEKDKTIIAEYLPYVPDIGYGHNRAIIIDNKIYSLKSLDNKTKGFYIWLSIFRQLDPRSNKIIMPRASFNFIITEIGAEDSFYTLKSLRAMLNKLANNKLIKVPNLDHLNKSALFDIEFLNVQRKLESFTQVFIGGLLRITNSKVGLNVFTHCYDYSVIRSFIFETKEDTKVITMHRDIIQERMGCSKATYYRKLYWLRDHGTIALYIAAINNKHSGKKVLMSDIRDYKNLLITIDDWTHRGYIRNLIE